MYLQTFFRWALITVPLGVVAILSAPEWPARAMMLDEPYRTPVLTVANVWNDAVQRTPVQNYPQDALVVESGKSVPTQAVIAFATDTHLLTPKIATPKPTGGTVLMLGDSLMGSVIPGMRQEMARSFVLKDKHKSSTGLTNQDYYNWPAQAALFAQEGPAEYVFIHLGGNDGQDMTVNGQWFKFGTEQWNAAYQTRAVEMISNIQNALPQTRIVWIGLPAMRPEKYNSKMQTISRLQQHASEQKGIVYVNGLEAMGNVYSKDGIGVDGKRTVLRLDDGIHYSREGGRIIAHTALKHL